MGSDRPSGLDARHVSLLWASPDRAPAVAAMHSELFNPAWSEVEILRLLEHPAAAALIATAGVRREPAGFVLAQIAADEAEILSLGVALKWQRAEVRRLFLEVSNDNEAALRLYRSLDFRRVGLRPKYYKREGSPPVDALVLALEF
jgi:[ribosomal protein S18]-alanine N-acetyltransferase